MRIVLDGCIVDSRGISYNGERWLSSISQIVLYQPIEFHIIFHTKMVEFLFNHPSIDPDCEEFLGKIKFYTELFITMLFVNFIILFISLNHHNN